MPFDIRFSKDLTINIRDCPHLLIIGKGEASPEFIEKCMGIEFCSDGCCCEDKERRMDERYKLLSAFNCNNIEEFNKCFEYEQMKVRVIFASSPAKGCTIDALKQILMKGRAVGMHIIMFADSVAEFGDNADLLDMFMVKLVYRVKDTNESVLLTGCTGAENLKDSEFVLCEIGKQPVVYESDMLS